MNKKSLFPLLIGIAALGLIGWGLWSATQPSSQPIQGQIESRTIDVASKLPGRVARVLVEEGQPVAAGDVLFDLASPEIDAKMTQATAAHEAAGWVSAKAQEGARSQEIRMAEMNWRRAVSAAELAKTTAKRLDSLYREGLVAQQKFDEAQTQAQASRAQADAARAQYDMALAGSRSEDKNAAAAQVRQAAGAISEVQAYQNEMRVLAPAAGEVAKIQIHAGELAPQGFPVITLVDRQDSWAVFNVREDQLPHFRQGDEFDGQLPGLGKALRLKVSWLSPLPDFATWKNVRGTQGVDLHTFEVRAKPLVLEPDLRPGMSVVVRP